MVLLRLGVGLLAASSMVAQTAPAAAAREWRLSRERSILEEFTEFLGIPNVTGDTESLRRNAEFIQSMFAGRGVQMQLFEIEGAAPVVYGELPAEGATQTVAFYAHYDGNPVEPGNWYTSDPFRPTLSSGPLERGGRPIPLPNPGWPTDPDWRLYARSASDDKSVIFSLATALDALRERNIPIESHLKFFFEGQLEAGSPQLGQYLSEHRELLDADLWVALGGTIHQNGQHQVILGEPGWAQLELTVYGPRREVDSIEYGGWAPDASMMLARLLASMIGDDGKVAVEGFYDNVVELEESALEAIAEIPRYSAARARELWVAWDPENPVRLEEVLQQPALSVTGIEAGERSAGADGVLAPSASASIGLRLVKGMDHELVLDKITEHVRQQGYLVVEEEPAAALRLEYPRIARVVRRPGYDAVRTSMDLPVVERALSALEAAHGRLIRLPGLVSEMPLHILQEVLNLPLIMVPTADPDDRRHGPNESIRLQCLWDGIETMSVLMATPAGEEEEAE